jgi:dTDP-4-amino-4,6-dideoxygalactose transaminase
MDEINAIANMHNLRLIEDAACAIGTTSKRRYVGGLGDIACFSFHPKKVFPTSESGAVTANRDELAALVHSRRNHGATGQPEPSLEVAGPWTMSRFDNLDTILDCRAF